MKRFIFLLAVLLSMSAMAEKNPDWSFPVEGKPMAIFKHNFTGIPVIETATHYYGVNFVEKTALWKVSKSKNQEALNQAGNIAAMTGVGGKTVSDVQAVSSDKNYQEIPFTPFVSINNRLYDVRTGNMLLGEGADQYRAILETDILPHLYVLLIKVKAGDGTRKLYSIDLDKKSVNWATTLAEQSGAKDALKIVAGAAGLAGYKVNAFAPQTTASNNIVYKHEKDLFLINSGNGDIIWKNECKPGTFFLDDNQKYLIVVEQASGAGSLMSLKGPVPFGKEIFALDLKSGENLWKKPVKLDGKYAMQVNINDDQFIAACAKGFNIYNFKTGAQKWKKNFEAKRIHELVVKDKGIEVFYGNKIMLVDMETGKKAWKKPFEFKDVPDDEEGSMIKKTYEKGIFIFGPGFIGLFEKESGKKIWKMGVGKEVKAAFDDRNKKIAVLDGKKFYLFDPNTVKKKPEKIKLDIENPYEIVEFETMDDGYFITGLNEYFFLDKSGGVVDHKFYKQLKTDRLLKAALATASVATGILSAEYQVTNESGEVAASGGLFMSAEGAREMGAMSEAQSMAIQKLKADAKLRSAVRTTRDFAYFMKGVRADGTDQMSVVKVDKKSGKEVESFGFGNNRKVIYELDKTTNKLYFLDEGKLNTFDLK